MTERPSTGRMRAAVMLVAAATLGAAIAGPGASIAQKMLSGQKKTDKRYINSGEIVTGGQTLDSKLNFNSGTFTPIAQTKLKTVGKGKVQVVATIDAEDNPALVGDGKLQYRVRVGDKTAPLAPNAYELRLPEVGGVRENGSISAVLKARKGKSQTIFLEAQEPGTGSVIFGRSVTATFIPKPLKGQLGKAPKGGKQRPSDQ